MRKVLRFRQCAGENINFFDMKDGKEAAKHTQSYDLFACGVCSGGGRIQFLDELGTLKKWEMVALASLRLCVEFYSPSKLYRMMSIGGD